ncbi:MAG: hypothetical protein KGJ66_01975 [Alphaproteobacteria bacterium]|nr:hypothetical protein [Alphaproteobacteria bacterium]
MREGTKRKVGAKRMWIRRWRQAGRISASEAKAFEKHLEQTGKLLKPKTPAPSTVGGRRTAAAPIALAGGKAPMLFAPAGPVVTIQYDPSKFRVEFTAIRRGRLPKTGAAHG